MHKLVFVSLIQFFFTSVFSQTIVLKGRVLDITNTQSIDFTNVYIHNSNIATSTHCSGSYELNQLTTTEKYNLYASHISYHHYKNIFAIHNGVNNINTNLTPYKNTITTIVIAGTGTHHRIDGVPVQTESITKKQKDISFSKVTHIAKCSELNSIKYNTKWESNHDLSYTNKTYYKSKYYTYPIFI